MKLNTKSFSASVEKDGAGLGPRQIKVLASSATMDRVDDVLVPAGCKTSGRVTILADHDASISSVIGSGEVSVKAAGVETVITFLDEGVSELADLACKLYKAGVLTDVSVGFDPIDYDYDKSTGGYLFKTWELLELSCVVIGCNPDAKVTGKAFSSDELSDLSASIKALLALLEKQSAIAGPKPNVVEQGGNTADPDPEDGTEPPPTNDEDDEANKKSAEDLNLQLRARIAAL
jgi:HK97 family phage prohead protease